MRNWYFTLSFPFPYPPRPYPFHPFSRHNTPSHRRRGLGLMYAHCPVRTPAPNTGCWLQSYTTAGPRGHFTLSPLRHSSLFFSTHTHTHKCHRGGVYRTVNAAVVVIFIVVLVCSYTHTHEHTQFQLVFVREEYYTCACVEIEHRRRTDVLR